MTQEKKAKPRRSKGEGTVFKNKRGTWTSRYKGKEFTGKTKAEAIAKRDEYKLLILTGADVSAKLTVTEYGKKYLYYKEQQVKRKKLKNSTYDRLERTFTNQILSSDLANTLMPNLESTAIQDAIDDMSEELSFSTIKKAYLFLQAMISYGKDIKDFPDDYDPLSMVELPDETALNVKTKEIEIIPDESLDILKKVAMELKPDGTLAYRYGPLIIFGLNTGLREGELLALSKKEINMLNGRRCYHVSETVSTVNNRDKNPKTKTKRILTPPKYPRSVRNIPLNKEADVCLQIMLDTYGEHNFRDDLIVATQNGKLPTSRNIQTSFDRILKKAGLPHYGTHALRHTFATRLLRKTQSHQEIKAVAELLGDDYHVVVKTYLHTEEEGKSTLVDLIA